MELKIISLLLVAMVTSGLRIFSIVSVPQITASSSNVPHQNNSIPSLPGKLALSETQKKQILAINWTINGKIDEILTVQQQKDFDAALARGQNVSIALNSLSLSIDQKNQLQQVFHWAQKQLENILNPEQLDYIQQQQQNRNHNPQPSNFQLKLEDKKYDVILHLTPRTTASIASLGTLPPQFKPRRNPKNPVNCYQTFYL